MILNVNAKNGNYDVVIERDCIFKASSLLNLNRKVLVISDSGVPYEYVKTIKSQCREGYEYIIKKGEKSKNFISYKNILAFLVENSFTRTDAVVAVGGGVVGDLGGFVSASYMRGIDFYNIPTTLLSQVDSSIGGKTAIDFCGIKNIIGAFYQPKKVLIDCNTLKTLSKRQTRAGLVEAIKMAATCDEKLFELIENSKNLQSDVDNIVYRALLIKKDVVEKDALEKGLRKVLNFGHTIGHAIESYYKSKLLHGECVALGTQYFCSDSVKQRLEKVYKKYGLPTYRPINKQEIIDFIRHDKKADSDKIDIIFVDKIGGFEIRKTQIEDIVNYL